MLRSKCGDIMGYKNLSIIQFIVIFFAAFAFFDYFYVLASLSDGFFIADMLFNTSDGLIGSIFAEMPLMWSLFHFMGYCMIIVGILQFMKASSVNA